MDIKQLEEKVKLLEIKLNGIDGSIQFIRDFCSERMVKEFEELKLITKEIRTRHNEIIELSKLFPLEKYKPFQQKPENELLHPELKKKNNKKKAVNYEA